MDKLVLFALGLIALLVVLGVPVLQWLLTIFSAGGSHVLGG